jgi:Protein of unknown function (DUF1670)
MLQTPTCVKLYRSANERFFKPAIVNFFLKNFPNFLGKSIAEKVADELIAIFEKLKPETETLEVGQVLWNALDKNTRGDSPNRRFVPVILTLINQEDVNLLVKGARFSTVTKIAIARMMNEAYEQGGILSTRDVALLSLRDVTCASRLRIAYEQEHKLELPHTGVLHDMGSCITHKKQIVYKIVVEKKDSTLVSKETNHSQKAVDHYFSNYNRVKAVYKLNNDIDFIHMTTNISKGVIKQYIQLYEEFELNN